MVLAEALEQCRLSDQKNPAPAGAGATILAEESRWMVGLAITGAEEWFGFNKRPIDQALGRLHPWT